MESPMLDKIESSIHVELAGTKDAKKLSLGDKVEIVVRGKVTSIDQRKSYYDDKRELTEVCLVDYSSKLVTKKDTTFSDLADD